MLYMDTITSAEFRKTYQRLTKPTTVTANGHVIGQWFPEGSASYLVAGVIGEKVTVHTAPTVERSSFGQRPFNSRPFTPAPKK